MRNDRNATFSRRLLSGFACLCIGLLAGFLVLTAAAWVYCGKNGGGTLEQIIPLAFFDGFLPLLKGCLELTRLDEYLQAVPLLLVGLSVALCGQAGLYQLGAAGPYAFGVAFTVCCGALRLPRFVGFVASCLTGAVWGWIPGRLKARFQTREALSTAFLGWAGVYGARALMRTVDYENVSFPLPGWWILVLPVGLALIAELWLKFTVKGYELRVMGQSEHTARYAGMDTGKITVTVMLASGALAGLAGGLAGLLAQTPALPGIREALTGPGMLGLMAAVFAWGDPLGTLLSALMIWHFSVGAQMLNPAVFPPEAGQFTLFFMLLLASGLMMEMRGKEVRS